MGVVNKCIAQQATMKFSVSTRPRRCTVSKKFIVKLLCDKFEKNDAEKMEQMKFSGQIEDAVTYAMTKLMGHGSIYNDPVPGGELLYEIVTNMCDEKENIRTSLYIMLREYALAHLTFA